MAPLVSTVIANAIATETAMAMEWATVEEDTSATSASPSHATAMEMGTEMAMETAVVSLHQAQATETALETEVLAIAL